MKTKVVVAQALATLCLLLGGSTAHASPQGHDWGLGVGGGTWTNGFSAKHMLGEGAAIQGVIGVWGPSRGGDGLAVSGDYLFEFPAFATTDPFELAWNFGFGADAAAWDEDGFGTSDIAIGAHGVLGLEFNFVPVPIDFTIEARPGVVLIGGPAIDLINGSAHVRWWF